MAATQHSSPDFRVGDWLAQPRLSRIEGNGQTVHVTPRAMAVLVYLAQKQGAVVSRNELLDAIWPRMAVTQDALSQCLVELRKAFGDDPKNPRVIETIPKVGVRLIAPIAAVQPARPEVSPPAAPNDKTTRRWSPAKTAWLTAATLALAGVALFIAGHVFDPTDPAISQNGRRSIAGADPEARDLYLSAVSEYSSRPDRHEALKIELDLLEAAVEKDPLFALAWARLGWTHTGFYFLDIDRSKDRLDLAKQMLDEAFRLDPDLPEWHLYLGNYYYRGYGKYDAALAELAIAEQSLAANPQLHLILASIHRQLGNWSLALEEIEKTVAFDRGNLFYRRQLFNTQMMIRDYAGADATLDGILGLQPDDVTAYSDKVLLALVSAGDTDLARRYDAEAPTKLYRDGRTYAYTRWLAAIFDREYATALLVLEELPGDELFFDDELQSARTPKSLLYARTHSLMGEHGPARDEYEKVIRETQQRLAAGVYEDESAAAAALNLAEAEAALGNQDAASAAAQQMRSLLSKPPARADRAGWDIAYVIRVLVPLGDDEEALDELESYLSKPGGIWSIEALRSDPRLDGIRENPRFDALVETYGRD